MQELFLSPIRTYFYPRSPCGERRVGVVLYDVDPDISIHALLAESDTVVSFARQGKKYFYPRSPCGERQAKAHSGTDLAAISIHALLAESDDFTPRKSL